MAAHPLIILPRQQDGPCEPHRCIDEMLGKEETALLVHARTIEHDGAKGQQQGNAEDQQVGRLFDADSSAFQVTHR